MQYSRWGLTRAEQRGTITSLSRLAIHLLMQPRILLAFWAAKHTDGSAVLSNRATVKEIFSQPVHKPEITLTQVQNLVVSFAESH